MATKRKQPAPTKLPKFPHFKWVTIIFILLFAGLGTYLLFFSFASTPVPTPNAGIWMVWGDTATANKPFVKGGQVVVDWKTVQTSKTTFNWSSLASGVKPYTDPSSSPYVNKPFTVQVNSGQKPKDSWWGYGSTIAWCGKFGAKANPGTAFDVPQFWTYTGGGGVNNDYMQLEDKLISTFANELSSKTYKNKILGVRTAPNLIGTEQHDFKSDQIFDVPSTAACNQTNWKPAWGDSAYNTVMDKYKTYLNGTGINPIFRARAYTMANPDGGMFFDTNANPDNTAIYANSLYYDKAKNGTMLPYTEPYQKSSSFPNAVSWNWWLILQALDRGVPYIAVYGDDIKKASNEACPSDILSWTGSNAREYQAAYCFANKYAPFANGQNRSDKAAASPGAWLAFTKADYSHGKTGYLSMYMTGSGITSSSSESYSEPTNPAQRYGRFARTISGSQSLKLQLNSAFKNSISQNARLTVAYLDSGAGNWTLGWSGGSKTIEKTNSGTWKTASIVLPGSVMKTADTNQIVLSTGASATTFHAVEVMRTSDPVTDSGSPPSTTPPPGGTTSDPGDPAPTSGGGSTGSDSTEPPVTSGGPITPAAPPTAPGDTVQVIVDDHVVGSSTNGTVPTIDTSTLTDGEHKVEVRVKKPNGTVETKQDKIVVKNNPNFYERLRNALLKPLAGKPTKTVNLVFGGIIVGFSGMLGGIGWLAWRFIIPKFRIPPVIGGNIGGVL